MPCTRALRHSPKAPAGHCSTKLTSTFCPRSCGAQKPLRNRLAGMLRFCWQSFTSTRLPSLCITQASARARPDRLSSNRASIRRIVILLGQSGDFSLSRSGFKPHHRPMLANIPTHLIGGPLGAGKTSLIRHLLAGKPAAERWAVLINEFGQIGLDQALLTAAASDGVSLSEIPGGCLCCVGGAPLRVDLTRLLRQARPDRLL